MNNFVISQLEANGLSDLNISVFEENGVNTHEFCEMTIDDLNRLFPNKARVARKALQVVLKFRNNEFEFPDFGDFELNWDLRMIELNEENRIISESNAEFYGLILSHDSNSELEDSVSDSSDFLDSSEENEFLQDSEFEQTKELVVNDNVETFVEGCDDFMRSMLEEFESHDLRNFKNYKYEKSQFIDVQKSTSNRFLEKFQTCQLQ